MPANSHRTDRRYVMLSVFMLLLSAIACATFREPGDPAPTRPPDLATNTATPTPTQTLTNTPAPTSSPSPTSIRTVTAVPTISATPEATPRPPTVTATSSDSS